MNFKSSTLALAASLAALLPAAGCDTQELHPNVMVSLPLNGETPAAGLGSWLYIYVAQDECQPGQDAGCLWYNLRIDGQMVVWPGTAEGLYDYVQMSSLNLTGLIVPPGTHVIELVEQWTGIPLIKTEAMEMLPDMLHNLAVFGPRGGLKQRWFIDDPALVPQGVKHARVLNALVGGTALQPVQCTDPDGVDCPALGAPIEHGGIFEAELTDAELGTFGWKWAAPGITDAAVNRMPFLRRSGFIGGDFGYVFHMPIRVQATAGGGDCPSCLQSSF
jgi:hypothetical protein